MKPTPEQLAKLPRWAQDHIEDISRQREEAIKALNDFQDNQTPSNFSYDLHPTTGEVTGPCFKTAYVQADTINVCFRGVNLSVSAHDYGNSGSGIMLRWEGERRSGNEVAMIPQSHQSVRLVAKSDMYPKD